MGKKKKANQFDQVEDPAMEFELEENAMELFLDHLDVEPPTKMEQDDKTHAEVKNQPKMCKKGSKDHEKVDLHGMTLAEACRFLDGRIEQWFSARSRQLDLEVVTGKGLHTKGKAVGILCREVHGYLCRKHGKLIHEIETSPDAVRLDGVPMRGSFRVKFRKR